MDLPTAVTLSLLLLAVDAQQVYIRDLPPVLPIGSSVTIECIFEASSISALGTEPVSYWSTGLNQRISRNSVLSAFVRHDAFERPLYYVSLTANNSHLVSSLIIDRLTEDHQAQYNCSYTWQSKIVSVYFNLTINPEYQVVTKVEDPVTLVCDGAKEVLEGKASGSVTKITWSLPSARIEWTPGAKASGFDEERLNFSDPSKLVIAATTFGDNGRYTCSFTVRKANVSEGIYETYNRTFRAIIRAPPGPVEKPFLVEANSGSLLIGWNESTATDKEKPTFFMIYYLQQHQRWTEAGSVNSSQNPALVPGLRPFTDYVLKVSPCNDIACAVNATSDGMKTKAAVPGKPAVPNDQLRPGTSYIVFTWQSPLDDKGPIFQYNVSWRERDNASSHMSALKNVSPTECMRICSINATNLEPEKVYEFSVFAINDAGAGEAVAHTLTTDKEAPGAPILTNVTFNALQNTLTLVFTHSKCPTSLSQCVDSYKVRYGLPNSTHSFDTVDTLGIEVPLVVNVTTSFERGETYSVALAGVRAALSALNTQNVGEYSNAVLVMFGSKEVEKSTTVSTDSADVREGPSNMVTIIVAVIVPLALSAIVVALVIFFVRRRRQHLALENDIQEDFWIELNQPLLDDQHRPYEESEYDCITTGNWSSHVADLHADSDMKFTQEFETICRQSALGDFKCLHSQEPNNRPKNRYNNILAYDHTRVMLKPVPGEINSDYINANYVDSYDKVRQFIATQGPLPNTIDDFWRMVWEQNTAVIVMITNVYEKGRKKCEQYWPSDGETTYGGILVRPLKEEVEELAFWTHRRFLLQNVKTKKKQQTIRYVSQYHYTDWPDHGTPEYSLPVLAYVRQACGASPATAGPIVVHCSAGVGRSGTFILLHSMMKHIDLKRSINVQGFLQYIRSQRNFLVQTEDQYVFVHDALLDYIQSGGRTELRPAEVITTLEQLSNLDGEGLTNVERQYKHVVKWRPREYLLLSSKKEVNRPKNRSSAQVPVDNSSRVKLPTVPGVEGSEYINASYLHGYFQNQEYIVTQHPLVLTEMDFWRMVWDQNSWTIVLLSNVGEEDMLPFWRPKNEATDGDGVLSFNVTFTDENLNAMDYVTRDFLLESKQDDYEMKTRMFSITYWPETFTVDKVFEFIEVVNSWHSKYRNQAGPIVVVDKLGGKMAATFCALSTLYNQLRESRLVDVYSLAYVYHQKRPGVWETEADYHYLYKAVAALCEKVMPQEEEKAPVNGSTLHGGTTNTSTYAFVRRMPSLPRSPGGQDRVNSVLQNPL